MSTKPATLASAVSANAAAYALGGAAVLGGLYLLLAPKRLTARAPPAIVPGAPVAPLTAARGSARAESAPSFPPPARARCRPPSCTRRTPCCGTSATSRC
jgi:hypothetical protein